MSFCLALACAMAWAWLLLGASAPAIGGMPPMADMPGMPGMDMSAGSGSGALLPAWLAAFAMWSVMMVAMMLPSAAPMILLYSAFARRVRAQGGVLAPTLAFAGVYLGLWTAFSAVAALVQVQLARIGLLSAATIRLHGALIAGGLLILAGLYQLAPIKRACLERCRSPLSFVTRLWRPGWAGAARLGLVHGAYCLGCCWLLMGLLFVGGVMNLAWVALLAVVVLIEKVAPMGVAGAKAVGWIAMAAGAGLLVWGLAG